MKNGTAKRKLKTGNGFTLAETLLAVLILLLVSVIVATGMPAAVNAYNKIVLGANAKTMLSTAVTALHDEIGTAWKVESSADKQSLVYFNGSTGAKSKISLGDDRSIMIQGFIPLSDDLIHDVAVSGDAYPLVSGERFTPKMYVTFSGIEYVDGIVTVSGLKVCKAGDNAELAEFEDGSGNPAELKIRVISAD